jgi:DnaJ family protein A protein 2
MNINLYDILGVSKNATFEEIKTKYKSLAQQHHPDKGGDPDLFKKIKHAQKTTFRSLNSIRNYVEYAGNCAT